MLRQRVVSALVGLALLALALWWGGEWGWAAFVAIAAVIGVLEFYRLARHADAQPLTLLGCIWAAALVFSPVATSLPDRTTLAVLGGGLLACLISLLARRDKKGSLATLAWTVAGVAYVGWFSQYLVALRTLDSGRNWVVLALLTTFATDTSAYFVGRAWGRHRLAPDVSPGKTREGAVAGLLGGMAAAWALSSLLHLPVSTWQSLLLGLLISVFAQLGDLTESLFKRSAGVKDSGGLLPGHGGLLDRIDSILLAGFAVYYYVLFV